jgi:hypothetical protein
VTIDEDTAPVASLAHRPLAHEHLGYLEAAGAKLRASSEESDITAIKLTWYSVDTATDQNNAF